MCLIDRLNNKVLILGIAAILMIIGLVHVVFGFLMEVNEFSFSEPDDTSPLFDFQIKSHCGNQSTLTLHRWGGFKEYDPMFEKYNIHYETDIKKINGNYFCYKKISYRSLLYNGQIIKNGSECPQKYHKNCGKLDTLEQELCIQENENCPIYEIGIGIKPGDENYIYNEKANVYYNNQSYNKKGKKIIGKLILNDRQPCYNSLEKLWKKFNSNEAVETNLKCKMEVFGKYNDDRYKNKGNISYKKLYEDNLSRYCQNILLNDLGGNEEVSLYQREFLGIDKECDKNFALSKDTFDKFQSNEQMEKTLSITEGFLFIFSGICTLIEVLCELRDGDINDKYEPLPMCIVYIVYIALITACFICQIVFLFRIKKYNLAGYNCSDSITNEFIRKGTENNSKQILYASINFYLDIFQGAINCIAILIGLVLIIIDKLKESKNEEKEIEEENQEKDNEESDMNINSDSNYPEIPLNKYYPSPY